MNSWSSPLGGSIKTATRFEMLLCTRSAASSAPAPPEASDTTMTSADATGSFMTSAHPAARKTGSQRERIETIANAANASTTNIGTHLGHMKIIFGYCTKVLSVVAEHRPCSARVAVRCWQVRTKTLCKRIYISDFVPTNRTRRRIYQPTTGRSRFAWHRFPAMPAVSSSTRRTIQSRNVALSELLSSV